VIAVNNAIDLLPSADVLYACDGAWWQHRAAVEAEPGYDGLCVLSEPAPGRVFAGERWTQHAGAAETWPELRLIPCDATAPGLRRDGLGVNGGGNGGFQALGMAAVLWGAARLILVGIDCRDDPADPRRNHAHGRHPAPLNNPGAAHYPRWIAAFESAAADLAALGVAVVDCSPWGALTCFRKLPLAAALEPSR